MKRSAIRVQASDGASHYLWLDRLAGPVFLYACADLLLDPATVAAARDDRINRGWWLWRHTIEFFKTRYGGRTAGLFGTYVPFDDVEYFPLLVLDAGGTAWFEDITGVASSDSFDYHVLGQMLQEVLREEPHANLAVALDYLLVDEEI